VTVETHNKPLNHIDNDLLIDQICYPIFAVNVKVTRLVDDVNPRKDGIEDEIATNVHRRTVATAAVYPFGSEL